MFCYYIPVMPSNCLYMSCGICSKSLNRVDCLLGWFLVLPNFTSLLLESGCTDKFISCSTSSWIFVDTILTCWCLIHTVLVYRALIHIPFSSLIDCLLFSDFWCIPRVVKMLQLKLKYFHRHGRWWNPLALTAVFCLSSLIPHSLYLRNIHLSACRLPVLDIYRDGIIVCGSKFLEVN